MPIEYSILNSCPYPLEKCPECGTGFPNYIRGSVQRSKRWFWIGPKRDYCAIICHGCKKIVGWESPEKYGIDTEYVQQQEKAMQHKWDQSGERCTVCGDKDWMNTACSGPSVSETLEQARKNVAHIIERERLGENPNFAMGHAEMTAGHLEEANDLLRSAHAIALRKGEDTNWPAFQRKLEALLVKQSKLLNNTGHLEAATCTPKTFRLPKGL